jgi:hypothetical protein
MRLVASSRSFRSTYTSQESYSIPDAQKQVILGIEFRENRGREISDFQSREDRGFWAKD